MRTWVNTASWSDGLHQKAGNITLGDGSVQQVTTGALRDSLSNATNNGTYQLMFGTPNPI
jgi:hypothetical protein